MNNNANFEFNLNQENPWANLSVGAKIATTLVGMAVAAAAISASIFFAGAALFAGSVILCYQWLSGRHKQKSNVIEESFTTETSN